MTTTYQRDSQGGYHEIVSAMPVRSCGRFVVHVDRKGQYPVEYGFCLDGERLCWTRPETQAERAAREAEVARLDEEAETAFRAYLKACQDWEAGGRLGDMPELPDSPEATRDGRVVRDVVAALELRGNWLSLSEWNQIRVLDAPREAG